jgi:uncharacterized protein YndB with AHSA1/START domain
MQMGVPASLVPLQQSATIAHVALRRSTRIRSGQRDFAAPLERRSVPRQTGAMPAAPHVEARVTRRLAASPARVFDAWLDPDLVRRWFAPGMGEMVRVHVEPRVGGTFSFVQRRGGDDVDHVGEYLELDRPRRLAFTWGVRPDTPSSRVVIDVAPVASGSEVALTHEMSAEWAEFTARAEEAWGRMLDAMATALG